MSRDDLENFIIACDNTRTWWTRGDGWAAEDVVEAGEIDFDEDECIKQSASWLVEDDDGRFTECGAADLGAIEVTRWEVVERAKGGGAQ